MSIIAAGDSLQLNTCPVYWKPSKFKLKLKKGETFVQLADEPVNCLSMGSGVQTTAILLKFWQKYLKGFIIFADTGDEKIETYYYIEKYLKPFCKEKGLKWITVKHKDEFTLMEWCIKRKIIPIRTRRWCTMDFKTRPINRFLRFLGATRKNPILEHIGFSLDESHRANFSKKDVLYVKKQYPLLDAKLTRRDCYKIIEDYGWPIPPKSGCDFCMFQKRKTMRILKAEHPERFHKIVDMEKNTFDYPKHPLIGVFTLDNLEKNKSLDDFSDEIAECDSGHCHT